METGPVQTDVYGLAVFPGYWFLVVGFGRRVSPGQSPVRVKSLAEFQGYDAFFVGSDSVQLITVN